MTVATVANPLPQHLQHGQASVATVASLYREARMATVTLNNFEYHVS